MKSIWEILGKVLTGLLIIVAIFEIVGYVNKKEPYIVAYCESYIAPIKPVENKGDNIRNWLIGGQPILKCSVSNKGNIVAKEVVFDLPYYYEVASIHGSSIFNKDGKSSAVNIGTLRPKKNINLVIWSSAFGGMLDQYDNDNYTISYAGGIGEIDLSYKSYGIAKSVAKTVDELKSPQSLIIFITSILIFIIITVTAYKVYKHHRSINKGTSN